MYIFLWLLPNLWFCLYKIIQKINDWLNDWFKIVCIDSNLCTHFAQCSCTLIPVTYILHWKINYFLTVSHDTISFIHSPIYSLTNQHYSNSLYIFLQSLSLSLSLSIIYIHHQFLPVALFSVYCQPVNGVCLLYQNSFMGSIQVSQTLP